MKQPQTSSTPAPAATPIPDSAVEAFRSAYATHGTQKGYAEAIRAGLAAAAPMISQDAMLSLDQDAHEYLVRQLDLALNGEPQAARAPVLTDLLTQCQQESRSRGGPVLTTMPPAAVERAQRVLNSFAGAARSLNDIAVQELMLLNSKEQRA